MQFRAGYELIYYLPQPTPMILCVNIHDAHAGNLIVPDYLVTDPPLSIQSYRDGFGNQCQRLFAPAGRLRLATNCVIQDSGLPDQHDFGAWQDSVESLPSETLTFLLGSRYCETDLLSQTAWNLFGYTVPGHARVQAICNWVHNHIVFNYQNARSTRGANDAYLERTGVCRDFAHLAIAFCRCMNIPARYCTGYLSDVGIVPPPPIGDFAAWMEVWIGGRWHVFDPRNNKPMYGRIVMARGRDAADVAIVTTFGSNTLEKFLVWMDLIEGTAD